LAGTATRSAASGRASGAFRPFRRDDQLQKFFGVIEQFVGLLGVHAERSRGQLRRDGRLGDRRIRRNEANFVHVNVRIALQGGLQLLG
jgi:hypothetical protein